MNGANLECLIPEPKQYRENYSDRRWNIYPVMVALQVRRVNDCKYFLNFDGFTKLDFKTYCTMLLKLLFRKSFTRSNFCMCNPLFISKSHICVLKFHS